MRPGGSGIYRMAKRRKRLDKESKNESGGGFSIFTWESGIYTCPTRKIIFILICTTQHQAKRASIINSLFITKTLEQYFLIFYDKNLTNK